MNTRNEWQSLLKYANEELAKYGARIEINDDDEEGFYDCLIFKNGKLAKVYAENYYEEELSDLVTEVWHYALKRFGKSK